MNGAEAAGDAPDGEEPVARGRKSPPNDSLSFVPTGAGTTSGKGVYYLVTLLQVSLSNSIATAKSLQIPASMSTTSCEQNQIWHWSLASNL